MWKILGAQEKFSFQLPFLPTSSLSSWFCKAYVTNVLKKNSIALLFFFSFLRSCKNCFSPFSSERWLGREFSEKKNRKEKKKKGVFFQQVYIYTTEWCKTIYSWSISIFAFDPRSTRFSRLAHWSLGRIRRFGWTHPELETSISLLLSSLIVDISLVSCSDAYILGLTFTGGLSTGTATYTGDWRPLTREVLLLVKRVVSLTFVLNFAKGGLILSIALGVCNKKKQRYFLNVRLTISKKNSRSCMLSTSLWTSSLNPLTPKNNEGV